MKTQIIALCLLALTGCQAPEDLDTTLAARTADPTDEAPIDEEPVGEEPEEEPEVNALLSSWTRDDAEYTVDLSALTNHAAGNGLDIREEDAETVWFDFGNVQCGARLVITGTNDNGTLEIVRVNGGTVNINNTYCNPLLGTYEYVALEGEQYRLCKGATCSIWE